ncbi:nucleotidyl transferase AbiEii/AbiGii toxin family protein [Marinomonas colpomeniae]|uniref:Nucleotidyl transferase AbiEii/AbiGii toxin family protein n=1 Tax=Marinomonas colpomeniae TaxID=2774408 RepID=A0ABR8P4A6_9GAMM|nr:nucleotidyl transferase AbiEii/AbiGii toxin family protein [Marinomonas colpomeniae]MBD5772659.1 nucleotidyl transferase AbiEii/AbiGii toxin family protein [Marinomonas colpomeniae]
MDQQLSINVSHNIPEPGLIQEVASQRNVSEAFIEKDWFAVQALKLISSNISENENIQTIFSGGTSLSKGHGLIQRFSEDLDFRCHYIGSLSQGQRRNAKRELRECLIRSLSIENFLMFNQELLQQSGKYFKFPLSYRKNTSIHDALRTDLELEFSFTPPRLPPVSKPIISMINEYLGEPAETSISCMQSVEIGADKLSALTWRVLKRDRTNINDDPTLVRHIHDLCALEHEISQHALQFKLIAITSFEGDQDIPNRDVNIGFVDSIGIMIDRLKSDLLYAQEYRQFAEAMSYADDDQQITFDRAILSLERIASYVSD